MKIVKAFVFSSVVAAFVIFLYKGKQYTELLISTLVSLPVLQVALVQGSSRQVYRYPKNCIILGTNERAASVATRLAQQQYANISGYVDDYAVHAHGSNIPVLCNLNELPAFLRQNPVDEAIICLPVVSQHKAISKSISTCAKFGIPVKVLMDLFDGTSGNESSNGDSNFITYNRDITEDWKYIVKRYFDLAAAFIMLIVFSPLLLLIAALIKLDSKGPVLFVQNRIGYNKHVFKLYKFRTMVPDAEVKQAQYEHMNEATGPVFKIKNDPRITRMGRLLRATSLDELPQLFNVIKGDMSLVGPRPLPLRDYTDEWQIWHCRRFSAIPGITCLWQISGRCMLTFDQWMELDLKYIDNWSLLLDFKILLKTVPAVLSRRGAC